MKIIRYILIIFVPVYYLIIWFRNELYDRGIFRSEEYDFPLICVGNLSVGGTGKTPMIEYLIRILSGKARIATLSRGYKRKTSGFVLANSESTAESIGDEPLQFFNKFKDIKVAVDSDRRRGISALRSMSNPPEIILLDDAFQHRSVKAGLNILLTKYDDLFVDDMLLPTGNLREPVSGRKRAHIVVVTKCPADLDEGGMNSIGERLKLDPSQDVYFSSISYSNKIKDSREEKSISSLAGQKFTLLTGIADASHLKNYLNEMGLIFDHLEYGDHHEFSSSELESFRSKDMILTTEKDYVRLIQKYDKQNLWYLPIEISLQRQDDFNRKILEYVEN